MQPFNETFAHIATAAARWAGRPVTFLGCCLIIVVWALCGPILGFSDTWQLIINTGTTIVTFLMVFLIQNTQNRDNAALQAKLDELIRASRAKNEYIGIEHLSDQALEQILAEAEKSRPHVVKAAQVRASEGRRKQIGAARKRVGLKTRSKARKA